MITYKHKDWETFKGTWYIVSNVLNDFQILWIIASYPQKYGNPNDWEKVS